MSSTSLGCPHGGCFLNGRDHLPTGLATGILLTQATGVHGLPRVAFVAACAAGSLLPDVDTAGTPASRWLTFGLDLVPGHRTGWTHSPVAATWPGLAVVAVGSWWLGWLAVWLGLGLTVGCVVHLLGDTPTLSGVPWLWPWTSRTYGPRWHRSGSVASSLLAWTWTAVAVALTVWLSTT